MCISTQPAWLAIHRINEAIVKVRKRPTVALGSIFHNTWHLFEESPSGFKHFGRCDAASGVLDTLEEYLKAEAREGAARFPTFLLSS